MSNRERAERFAQYVGLELKGQIAARGWTALRLAQAMKRSPSAMNRWLNGKQELPLAVLGEASELLGIEPHTVVETAYGRMAVALGEPDGYQYPDDIRADAEAEARAQGQLEGNVGALSDDELRDLDLSKGDLALAAGDDRTTDDEDTSTP